MDKLAMIRLIAITVLAAIGAIGSFVFNDPDNAAEQAAERMIDSTIGLPDGTTDITPHRN